MTDSLTVALRAVRVCDVVQPVGRVRQIVGLVVEVQGLNASLGEMCRIEVGRHAPDVHAEVVGFRDDTLLLMPYGDLLGIAAGNRVRSAGTRLRIPAGTGLLGRVVNAFGDPIDGRGPLAVDRKIPLGKAPPNAMQRRRIERVLATGVRAIDAFVTCAEGQRLGIFAGSGVGKSVLLGMLSRHGEADVNVVGLVGERGREVREFLEEDLGAEGLERSVVVVATSDESPVVRVRAAETAMAIAESLRDDGNDVMFLMDSVTRYCMALREIGLAAGEPPTTKGYTPSVFAQLPRLLERAGMGNEKGITGFFTVLVEGDDMNDPVADAVRSILDGHLVLSRDLARRGQFPAIDVMGSVSRLMPQIAAADHQQWARRLLRVLKLLEDNEDLVNIGAYRPGSNPEIDAALRLRPRLQEFLGQALSEAAPLPSTLASLKALASEA